MNRRPSALERLLELRETEESVARSALQTGLARLADLESERAAAAAAEAAARAQLTQYAESTAAERRDGFTIAARLLHAEGERALAVAVDAAVARAAQASARVSEGRKRTDQLRAAYADARGASEIVRRRVATQHKEARTVRARREEHDSMDALLARRAAEQGENK